MAKFWDRQIEKAGHLAGQASGSTQLLPFYAYGYFHTPEFDHIRIEACDGCQHYIKGIELTRVGFAAPIVDEIYDAPLDLWAREHGYTKIELNLLGYDSVESGRP